MYSYVVKRIKGGGERDPEYLSVIPPGSRIIPYGITNT